MVLYVLSQIWKFGGVIERDKSDNQLVLKNSGNIPAEVLKAAGTVFADIDAYLLSVEGMNAIDTTLWKMITVIAGWQKNDSINNFLCGDETALNLFFEYQAKLAVNGWVNAFEDWRQYETDETKLLKEQIYKRATVFMQKGAK